MPTTSDPSNLGDGANPAPGGDLDPVANEPDQDNDYDGAPCRCEPIACECGSELQGWSCDGEEGSGMCWEHGERFGYHDSDEERPADCEGGGDPSDDNEDDASSPLGCGADGCLDGYTSDGVCENCEGLGTDCNLDLEEPATENEADAPPTSLDEEADFWEAWDDFAAQHGRDPEPEELAQMLAENEEDCDEDAPGWCDACSLDPCSCDDGPDDLSDLGPLDEDEENPDV